MTLFGKSVCRLALDNQARKFSLATSQKLRLGDPRFETQVRKIPPASSQNLQPNQLNQQSRRRKIVSETPSYDLAWKTST
jgi:hypothetical protein